LTTMFITNLTLPALADELSRVNTYVLALANYNAEEHHMLLFDSIST